MVVISSLCILALCLPHTPSSVRGYLSPRTLSLWWETVEPIQTPTHLNATHSSIIEIIKKALALKIQTQVNEEPQGHAEMSLPGESELHRQALLAKACQQSGGRSILQVFADHPLQ